jgi:beta-N-acetylhexosaminidase
VTLGPVMLDLEGTELTAEEREILRHPAVGGVILFARNFDSPAQLAALTEAIRRQRGPHFLVAVDQEGGRVQRFREGFCRLPPAGRFGRLEAAHPGRGLHAAEAVGWLMAAELRAVGVDFSFAPVLDLDRGASEVIGDRAFAAAADRVTELAGAWIRGVRAAGMAAVGKHFPGHGGVAADSHTELPVDTRPYATLEREDLVPFVRLIRQGLEAVMPAHVVYCEADRLPAGFSPFWLKRVLRERLGFEGVVFSDDLNMAAAAAGGDFGGRARAAMDAGCDMVLVCNNRPAALEVLHALRDLRGAKSHRRRQGLHGRGAAAAGQPRADPRWSRAMEALAELEAAEAQR